MPAGLGQGAPMLGSLSDLLARPASPVASGQTSWLVRPGLVSSLLRMGRAVQQRVRAGPGQRWAFTVTLSRAALQPPQQRTGSAASTAAEAEGAWP